ncbi:DUF1592 domain-containing protein [Nannocystis sp.]|uniref:DUF1592 domain-containing protein n=1 Tax=Nannocystis sp. TaxID=1962667 RepID=UPI0025EC0607|nr:DUF1592 domain-containing protein [Nannocystis sp.]MBK7825967.1 DUF1592 domain-containing protein [Nannocystis sp.]
MEITSFWPRRRTLGPAALVLLTLGGACYSGADGNTDSNSGPTAGPASATADDGAPTTSAGDDTSSDDTGATPAEFDPAPVRLRLLLARHYQNAVRDLLGEAAAAAATPPVDTALNGFEAIAAAQVALTDAAVDLYEKSARAVAAEAMKDPVRIAGLLGCQPTGPDDAACHRSFVTTFGRLVWRRPLTSDEQDRYTAVAQDAALQLGNFDAGVEAAIFTFLQSPYFLYQVEVGEPDPNDPEERGLTSIEMATRLSFFLLDTTPTAEILTLAESGGLDSPAEVRAVAEVMVEAPGARLALGNFYAEVLKLRTIETLAKDPNTYPQFSPTLAAAMRQETLALVDDVAFTADTDFRAILDAPYTFVNGPLAALYGLIPDPNQLGDTWQRFDLPAESKRGGILGQAAFLSAYAHVSSTSPTLRGKFVREALMCIGMPPPPPDVVTKLPEGAEYKTMRERLAQHKSEPCVGCHSLMDPIGLGLENFDGIGIFRAVENGVVLDTSETIEGLGDFDGARELGTLLRDSPEVTECMVRNLFRHATGHLEIKGEYPALTNLDLAFEDAGYRMKDLLVELVASPAFLRVGTPE